jgi:hypothetical protein
VVRRISQGPYPPPPGTLAYPRGTVPVDADGVPLPPPPQAATDCLATAASGVTGLGTANGEYRLDGLPPGDYLVGIQQINPNALQGSGIGPLGSQIPLPEEEYYNGPNESGSASDIPSDFTPVSVQAGTVTSGIDIVLNGFGDISLASANEVEPNEKKKKAQVVPIDEVVTGSVSPNDTSKLTIDFDGQGSGKVHDLYKITLTQVKTVFISVNSLSGQGDIDLYLFNSRLKGKTISISSAVIEGFSAGPTATEFIGLQLGPGSHYIGVSGFDGSEQYMLRVLATQ